MWEHGYIQQASCVIRVSPRYRIPSIAGISYHPQEALDFSSQVSIQRGPGISVYVLREDTSPQI